MIGCMLSYNVSRLGEAVNDSKTKTTKIMDVLKELLETIKNNSIDNKCTIENVDLFVKSWTKETETLQLRKADVMVRCFKNYKGQFFIYKSRITKSETKFKVARNFESQGRTVLVSENNNKYYLHEVAPYNEP